MPRFALKFRRDYRRAQELHRIDMVRRGIDLSPAAWVIPGTSDAQPWPLPDAFRIDELPWDEIKVGMSMGIFTIDVLTDKQQQEHIASRTRWVGKGTARRLLKKIADATADQTPS